MSTRRWLWALAALAIAATGACIDDEAGPTSIAGGRNAINVGFDFGTLNPPEGDAVFNFVYVAELDTVNNPTDLLGRMDGTAWDMWPSPRYSNVYDLGTDYGRKDEFATRQWVSGWVPDDPRKPFLGENTNFSEGNYDASQDHIRFYSPASSRGGDCPGGVPCWTYQSDIDGMWLDNSWGVVGLARYALQVNGLVDHLEILVYDGEVQEPDSLILLGGTLQGYPNIESDYWMYNPGDCMSMLPNANPFIMGRFKLGPIPPPNDASADYTGETDADYCYFSNGVWGDAGTTSGQQPFAPNNFSSFDLPAYNYIVFWGYDETADTIKFDEVWMRGQIGNDIDLNGNPIPHAFAPFPTAPGRELSDYDDFADFLGDPVVAAGADSMDMVVYNLKPLASGSAYQVWLFHELDNEVARVSPTYTLQRPDTTGEDDLGNPIIEWVDVQAPETVSEFNSSLGYRHVIQLRDAELGGISMADFSHAAITIGASGDASPLDSPNPACFYYSDKNGTEDVFDNLLSTAGALTSYCSGLGAGQDHWVAFGAADASFLSDTAVALGLNRLARPPLGHYYEVWFLNNGEAYSLGEITTPPPSMESLMDADIDANDGVYLTDTEIFAAGKYFLWADLPDSFYPDCIGTEENGQKVPGPNDCAIAVTLEPKAGDRSVMGSTVIFLGAVPRMLHSDGLIETESR